MTVFDDMDDIDFSAPVQADVKPEPAPKPTRTRRKKAEGVMGRKDVAVAEPEKAPAASPARDIAPGMSPDMVQMLERALHDGGVDVQKLKALLDIQKEMILREEVRVFQTAMVSISNAIPQVGRNGIVDMGEKGNFPFAKWDHMDRVLRPLMKEHRIRLSFTTEARDGGGAVIIGTASHDNGQSQSVVMSLPLDIGPGRNNLQAMGSTISYGKRYTAEMLFNIVRTDGDDDDDGASFGVDAITHDQADELLSLIRDLGTTEEKACKGFFLPDLGSMPAGMFLHARSTLKKAIQNKRGNG